MKKVLLFALILIGGFGVYWVFFKTKKHNSGPKQQPLALKKHSATFNKSVTGWLDNYFGMKDAFVDADTASVKANCIKFIQLLDSLPLDELKKDTASIFETVKQSAEDIKSNATSLLQQPNVTEMRKDFKGISENMYPFLKSINYEGPDLYWQNCPMAFDEEEANWVSQTVEVVNPYLGKNHPKYKSSMLECGSLKDTIQGD